MHMSPSENNFKANDANSSLDLSNKPKKQHAILAVTLTSVISILAVAGISFAVLRLHIHDPIKFGLSDWLKAALPVAGGAMVVIFAFLGVNRLKDYDERQDKLGKELREELLMRLDKVDDSQKKNMKELQERQNAWLEKSGAMQEKLYQRLYDELNVKLSQKTDTLIEKLNADTDDLIVGIQTRAKALSDDLQVTEKKYNEVFGKASDLKNVEAIGNVREAHDYIAELYAKTNNSDKTSRLGPMKFIVDRVLNGEIIGDYNDYHNLSAELARNDYFGEAADIVNKGLELFADNVDLISAFVLYSQKAGRISESTLGLQKLKNIDVNLWNWRAFTFYIDTLNASAATLENREESLHMVSEYKRVLPNDERAYMAEYETYKKYGNLVKARASLEEAEEKLAMTAQCSLTLADIYHMDGKYDMAIAAATRAIIGQAEIQPSSNTGAAFARRALARDARICRAVLGGSNNEDQQEEVSKALRDYKMALDCGFVHQNLYIRMKILNDLLPVDLSKSIFDESKLDAEEDSRGDIKRTFFTKLLMLLDMDKQKLEALLSALQELSPISSDNHEKYLQLFLDAAGGDVGKASQIQLIVESLFS